MRRVDHLRREAPDPLYIQLREALEANIHRGQYRTNERLPSERELSEAFGVSRMTARQALLALARDGIVYTRVGKGTFVAEPKIAQQLQALSGFSQDMVARGSKPASRVLASQEEAASAEVASALGLTEGARVVLLERVRLADGVPLAVETAYLPADLAPGLLGHDFSRESLYEVLEREYRLVLTRAEQRIEAVLAGPRELELLQLVAPAAVLRMERLTRAADGRALEWVRSAYRGDRYTFCSTLVAQAIS